MALIGFARVSSVEQDLTEQLNALKKFGCEKIFEGKNSGKKESNAERLKELLSYVREGDTVVVTKLDRLGRSVIQVLSVLDQFREMGVRFKTLDGVVDTTNDNPMAQAMIGLLAVFSELERDFIVSRTTEGKRAKGKLQGRPEALDDKEYKRFAESVAEGLSLTQLQKEYGLSRATVVRWKKRILEGTTK